jgi:hypothetical protein
VFALFAPATGPTADERQPPILGIVLALNKSTQASQYTMAGFLRGKQAGIQNDLSAGILPGLFAPDDQARFGINSQIGYVREYAMQNTRLTRLFNTEH